MYGWFEGVDMVVVMLDQGCVFEMLELEGMEIWWGVYFGMVYEVLEVGLLEQVGVWIVKLCVELCVWYGWIMDIYVMWKIQRGQVFDRGLLCLCGILCQCWFMIEMMMVDWVWGDIFGFDFFVYFEVLKFGGFEFLICVFYVSGVFGQDNCVMYIIGFDEWMLGGIGVKVLLLVVYECDVLNLWCDLFVKFLCNF